MKMKTLLTEEIYYPCLHKLKNFLVAMLLYFLLSNSAYAAPVTFNAKDLDLHDTLMLIANMGNLNISVDDSVKGTITISFDSIEPIDALKIIAKTKDLNIVEDGSNYIITAIYLTNALMNTYVLPVKYGDAEKFREIIANSLDLKKRFDNDESQVKTIHHLDGTYTQYRTVKNDTDERENNKRVTVNKDVNALILFGTLSEYERAKALLKNLDVPLKQVMIEAKIVSIDKSAAKNLGIEWSWSTFPQHPTRDIEVYDVNDYQHIVEKYTRQQNSDTGYGIISFGRGPQGVPFEWYYGAKINALISNGKAKMLSRPNITTIQGNEATINVGSEIPVPTRSVTNSTETTTYEYKDVGIILKCTPRINEDGSVTSITHAEVSVPQFIEDMGVYRFNKRSATTTVTLKDGESMVIGGLIGKEEENNIRKIPFLGDLPILGALFRNHHKTKAESELMIFLTAHVLNPNEQIHE